MTKQSTHSWIRLRAECLIDAMLCTKTAKYCVRTLVCAATRSSLLGPKNKNRAYNLFAVRTLPATQVRTRVKVPSRPVSYLELELTLTDELSRQWYYFGYDRYEAPVVTALVTLSERAVYDEMTYIIDVGANVGFFSLLAGAILRDRSARVISFEPSPAVFRLLDQNAKLNPNLSIATINKAVSDNNGEADLFFAHESYDFSSASLVEGSVAQAGSVRVSTTTLDSCVAQLPPGRVSIVKMDCEGVEAKVLAGMRHILERDSPHIVLEILPRYPTLPDDLAALPFFKRYRKFLITEAGLIEHQEIKPTYQNRDWLLTTNPPARLIQAR